MTRNTTRNTTDLGAADDLCPPDRCHGCWSYQPRQGGRNPELMDLRTGRRFCHECMAALVTWELDGSPDGDELCYAEWLTT